MKPEDLKKICPLVKRAEEFSPVFTLFFDKYGIDTVNRQAMFLAQTMHESACFKYVKEIWGPTKWQVKYEGHKGLGNVVLGDGKKFMGRGLIQLTGRSNYQAFANWMDDQKIMENPSLVEGPGYAVLSAIWFWNKNNLNRFADADDIVGCTRAVNGKAMLGLVERKHYYDVAKKVLQSTKTTTT